ncbi:hypothetical protein Caci_7715 [Catenulispora acidiphila DSM 44928]|uniref:Uncharacterized protein n=1 Tax=Catenulispora acidiphila (strain DSM 44928 / JCM 14897 / NBRC 102108 / NRRL B-24433 / ID139908) TaxID=479433 RepID=C7QCS6_CATAD|nr:hypothetical protein [Catenulispora acidiphila]ACU76539.1 hypothetical protein Caci_7715 [Catenulispora acidiphila DSM 44928]
MSEFEEALARSVQDGIARGGLPGAADAVRQGRRRSLRARGGVTMLGVAVVAGALGGAGVLGGGTGTAAGSGTDSFKHADDGVLPAAQWPAYDVAHWKVAPSCSVADRSKCRPGDPTDDIKQVKAGDLTGQCGPTKSFPVLRFVQYATQEDELLKLDGDEIVLTLPSRAAAAAFMAEARTAGSPRACAGVPGAEGVTPGVDTADGVSWEWTEAPPNAAMYGHGYLVRVDDRVAFLRLNQTGGGDTVRGTAGDETVLKNLEAALSK